MSDKSPARRAARFSKIASQDGERDTIVRARTFSRAAHERYLERQARASSYPTHAGPTVAIDSGEES